jgi:hypothetical protein
MVRHNEERKLNSKLAKERMERNDASVSHFIEISRESRKNLIKIKRIKIDVLNLPLF